MKIGTPLTPGAPRVRLLGSGELGKEVIIALPSSITRVAPGVKGVPIFIWKDS